MIIEFELMGEYIELMKLLKATQVAETGGVAKAMIEEGCVFRDGQVETRKRAKIRKGEKIEADGQVIVVC